MNVTMLLICRPNFRDIGQKVKRISILRPKKLRSKSVVLTSTSTPDKRADLIDELKLNVGPRSKKNEKNDTN